MSKHASSIELSLGSAALTYCALALGAGTLLSALACSSGSADPDDPQTVNQGGNTSTAGNGSNNGTSGSTNNTSGSGNNNTSGSGGSSSSNGGAGSGDGGSQSSGGESGGNAGSTNGGAANDEPSVCDGATDVRLANNGYVDNLEDDATDSDLFWDSYVDANGGMADNRTFTTPGALGTGHAIHYAGSTFETPGMGYAGLTRSLGCTDVSVFDGVSFWAKGTAGLQIFLQVGTPKTQKEGGDCLELCYDHPEKPITLTADWAQYTVTWDELAQQGFGNPAEFENMVVLLNWRTDIGAFDFSVDEVTFFAGDAPTDPVLPPGGAVTPGGDAGL